MDHPLPRTLQKLENGLRAQLRYEPSLTLRGQVMSAVEAELSLSVGSSPTKPGWDGWSLMAVAAAVMVVLNVSLISASHNEFSVGSSNGVDSLSTELRALQSAENHNNGDFK